MAILGEANIGGRMVPAWILNGNANGLDISESSEYPGCFYRKLSNGGVEWINPPMSQNEEYRTVERFSGLPVYKKLINMGNVPAPGSIASLDNHGIGGIVHAISATPLIYKSNWSTSLVGNARISDVDFSSQSVAIRLSTGSGDLSSYVLLVLLTYTKAN